MAARKLNAGAAPDKPPPPAYGIPDMPGIGGYAQITAPIERRGRRGGLALRTASAGRAAW
jgi:hypothetical protein